MDETSAEFDRYAGSYRQIHDRNVRFSGEASDYFAEHKMIEVGKAEQRSGHIRFLDFGCGDGVASVYFSKQFQGQSYVGIDVSEESIKKASQKARDNIIFSVFDGFHIPYGDCSFDIVFIANVFHHIRKESHGIIIREIERVLDVSGRLYIFEHNPLNPATQMIVKTCVFDRDATLIFASEFRRSLKNAGFDGVSVKYLLFFPRYRFLNRLIRLEDKLGRLPLGAQYMVSAVKNRRINQY